ncbi:MAG: 30S ribosomal protein S17 [Elusimicrobiota bacterium]
MTTDSAADKPVRGRRHRFVGVVLSDKADKTRVVSVERRTRHPRYEKVIQKRAKFYVHDEKNESQKGDLIEIMGTRPLSKLKRWRFVRVVKAAPRAAKQPSASAAAPAPASAGASGAGPE